MESFIAVLHILIAVVLVTLILLQDSKGASLGGSFGGGGSQSLFGATGAVTLAQRLTRWLGVGFAGTCLLLSLYSTRSHKSIVDGVAPAVPTPAAGSVAPVTGDRANQPQTGAPGATNTGGGAPSAPAAATVPPTEQPVVPASAPTTSTAPAPAK